jgi:SpoVK/Ycf46/Vps4 family AAA+-type ATPase
MGLRPATAYNFERPEENEKEERMLKWNTLYYEVLGTKSNMVMLCAGPQGEGY